MIRSSSGYSAQMRVFSVFLVLFLVASPAFTALPFTEDNESPFALVYEKVAPTVVLIEIEGEVQRPQRSATNPWDRYFNIPPETQQTEGMGSGVIIDERGYILTNNHVVEDATKISVKLDQDLVYDATIVGRDPMTDLAIIRIQLDGDMLTPDRIAVMGDSDSLRPGDYTIAIGNPMGLERTITVGVISGVGRYSLPVQGATDMVYQNFIQTDAQINPGNSGGALVNIDGEVIGINNMYAVQYAAIGFAIPINMAKKVATQLIETGVVKRGFVGIGGKDITKDIRDTMDISDTRGILIDQVTPGFPAADAGIQNGDVITSLNGEPIVNYNDFLLRIGELMPGEEVTFDVISEGEEKEVSLTLADRDEFLVAADTIEIPSNEETDAPGSWRGINVVNLDNPLAERYNLQDVTEGVVIIAIDRGSPADDSTLQEGEVIIEIDGDRVGNVSDFERIKRRSDSSSNILLYRMRRLSDGRLVRGYVAIRSE